MKSTLLVAALAASFLTGCGAYWKHYDTAKTQKDELTDVRDCEAQVEQNHTPIIRSGDLDEIEVSRIQNEIRKAELTAECMREKGYSRVNGFRLYY